MTLEQLNEHFGETLSESHFTSLNELQLAVVSKIKKGGDAVIVAGKGTGKTTAIAIASMIKAPKAFEGSPRVLVLSSSVESVHALHKQLSDWTRRTEIAVELAHDKGNMVLERNNIFDGADIIVGNTKRIMDLYIQNGIHVGQLNLFVIDDASEITKSPTIAQHIHRLAESLPKCQKMIFTQEMTPRVEKLVELLCVHPTMMEFEPSAEN